MQLKKDLLRCFSVASCFLIPTIIFSNIGTTAINFNRVAEFIYPVISFHPEPTSKNSRIAILEIDAKTEKDFGWPLPRSVFAKTFRELQQNSGHPLVVSLLHFQEKTDSATNVDFEIWKISQFWNPSRRKKQLNTFSSRNQYSANKIFADFYL